MGSGPGKLRAGVEALFARRPAVPVALALIGGMGAASVLPGGPIGWVVGMGVLVAVALLTWRREWVQSIVLLGAIFAGGVALWRMESLCFPSSHIGLFTSEEGKLAELELRVASEPRSSAVAVHGRPLPPKQFAPAEVVRAKTRSGWVEASGEVALTIDQPDPLLRMGQRVRVVGMLQRPAGPRNPGEFDAARFYRDRRVLATMNVPHVDGVTILSEPGFAPLAALRQKARHLLAAGFTERQSLDHSVLLALALGDREHEMLGVQDDFSRSGTAHLLAVSGLHVILIAGFVMGICRAAGAHPRAATWGMMAVVLMYCLIALPAAPVVRATVLCLAMGASHLTRRHRDGIQVLAMCAVGLLLQHPHELHGAGFQLSFLTVLGMLVCATRIMEWCKGLYDDEDTRVARMFRPPGAWASLGLHLRGHLTGSLAIGAVAWLVSLPLVMFHFDQWNPWAIFAGLLLFPVVALGLIGGLLKIVLTLLLPSLAHWWAALAAYPMVWMRHEVNWLAHLPGANVPMAQPPVWGIAVFYLLLMLPLLPWTVPAIKRWIRCAPAAAALLAMLPWLMAASPGPGDGQTRITLLSVGAGQIGIVELSNGRTLLIDDGSSSISDPLRKCLGPYLRSRGCRHVETIYLSHPDFDHISATADTADEYHPDRVMISPVFRGQAAGNAPAEQMLKHLDETHVPVDTITRGRRIELDADIGLEVLWPPAEHAAMTTNNAGVVLRLNCHGRTVLFPADIQVATERELMAHPENLSAEVLVAPHHGSAESTTAEFIRAVGPSSILSSNDRRLSKKQREFDRIVGALPLYRTSVCGAVTVRISKKGEMRVETFLKGKEVQR